ncbi:hypothetical protein PMM47T1_21008 [Pseudomonas sp. M47T1]|uniref:hypothetical protein n=1 Tax=unclassified Pseudomonas TaxID=196821 RepID=UPI000260761D|nr:hypothetical protein [Pseudomonas sp. M47T1]EIK94609.1 hypothetical protein PMM47T1_21008 [Pseudomonas sp. M47T1]
MKILPGTTQAAETTPAEPENQGAAQKMNKSMAGQARQEAKGKIHWKLLQAMLTLKERTLQGVGRFLIIKISNTPQPKAPFPTA